MHQYHGFTCGIDDLLLLDTAEHARNRILTDTYSAGREVAKDFIGAADESDLSQEELIERLSRKLRQPGEAETLDTKMMGKLNNYASDVIKHSLPWGQSKRFPSNNFSMVQLCLRAPRRAQDFVLIIAIVVECFDVND